MSINAKKFNFVKLGLLVAADIQWDMPSFALDLWSY